MFPILKTGYFHLWVIYKSDSCISCFRNFGEMKVSKVHRTYHSINGGSLEITHVFHLSIITSYKKYFKISLLPLTCLQCEYIFDINYVIKQDIHIYIYVSYSQTAGPIGLNFFVDTHRWSGINRIKFFFLIFNFFNRQRQALQLFIY